MDQLWRNGQTKFMTRLLRCLIKWTHTAPSNKVICLFIIEMCDSLAKKHAFSILKDVCNFAIVDLTILLTFKDYHDKTFNIWNKMIRSFYSDRCCFDQICPWLNYLANKFSKTETQQEGTYSKIIVEMLKHFTLMKEDHRNDLINRFLSQFNCSNDILTPMVFSKILWEKEKKNRKRKMVYNN